MSLKKPLNVYVRHFCLLGNTLEYPQDKWYVFYHAVIASTLFMCSDVFLDGLCDYEAAHSGDCLGFNLNCFGAEEAADLRRNSLESIQRVEDAIGGGADLSATCASRRG